MDKDIFTREDLVSLLSCGGEEAASLFQKAKEIKEKHVGNVVHFRGLVEYSNKCNKNCYYCGIRSGNRSLDRYTVTEEEVLHAARTVLDNRYGSMVLQSGECSTPLFVRRIAGLIEKIKQMSNNAIGITLSCGEQSGETYRQWFEAGAHRYLLRIESSNQSLYEKIHPQNKKHDYLHRLACLSHLRQIGYQVGTGVMIGFPMQTVEHLAEDLLFFKAQDIDMVGMGPYIEHSETPFYQFKDRLLPLEERFALTLKMIALTRIMMKNINIVASTAMQAIDARGREKALLSGANIIMPNLTPQKYRKNYLLYQNKPCVDENSEMCKNCLANRVSSIGHTIGYDRWGDSLHFNLRNS